MINFNMQQMGFLISVGSFGDSELGSLEGTRARFGYAKLKDLQNLFRPFRCEDYEDFDVQ